MGVVSRPLILSLCGVVRERLLPCRVVVTAKWVGSCTRITCIQLLSRCSLTLLASSFCSESVVVVFSLFSPSFSPCVLSFLSLAYWPFRTRFLIRAAILYFCCLHLICIHPDALSSVILISVLLYQSAAFVFLDGSLVSEWLV